MEKKVALVTGAAQGIGLAITKVLVAEGILVAGMDMDVEALREAATLPELGESFYPLETDVTKEEDIASSLEKIIAKWDDPSILVNNAGGSFGVRGPVEEISTSQWDIVLNTNLKATFFLTRATVPAMKKRKWGRIVNMSSIAGRTRSYFGATPYASAKAGIIGFTRQASRELGIHGITINAVAPGVVISGKRIEHYWHNVKTEEERQGLLDQIPLGRVGTNEDVAFAVNFLCSEGASYITGAVIDTNGGFFVG